MEEPAEVNESRSEYKQHRCSPFIMDAEELQKLDASLRTICNSIEYAVTLSNKVTTTYKTLDSVLNLENSSHKPIVKIRLCARKARPGFGTDTRAWLDIDNDHFNNVYISMDGLECEVPRLLDCVNERLSAMKPWYWPIAHNDVRSLICIAIGSILFVAGGVIGSAVANLAQSTGLKIVAFFACGLGFPALGGAIGYSLYKALRHLFPVGVFAIGQGIKRQATLANWQWLLVGTIPIGAVISFAFSWGWKVLFG